MMKNYKPAISTFIMLFCMMLISCGSLKPVTVNRIGKISGYKYAYINSTATKVGSSGSMYATGGTGFGASITKSTNPSDVISGFLMKKGFIIVPSIRTEDVSQTIVVNYAETGRRNLNLGYTIEITIQMLSAKDNSLICTGTAEGQGETEADDIRIAINRCLMEIFK